MANADKQVTEIHAQKNQALNQVQKLQTEKVDLQKQIEPLLEVETTIKSHITTISNRDSEIIALRNEIQSFENKIVNHKELYQLGHSELLDLRERSRKIIEREAEQAALIASLKKEVE